MDTCDKDTLATPGALHLPTALKNYRYPEENLLPALALDSDLPMVIDPLWPEHAESGQQDLLEVWYAAPDGRCEKALEYVFHGPTPTPAPLTLYLPHSHLRIDGVGSITYKVRRHDGSLYESISTPITVDRRTPLGGTAGKETIFDPELSNGEGVTHAYLEKHCDVVTFTIPKFEEQRAGDRVGLCCGGPNEPPFAYTVIQQSGRDTVMVVPGEFFRGMPDGTHLCYYKLSSRAGQEGVNSMAKFIRIVLGPKSAL